MPFQKIREKMLCEKKTGAKNIVSLFSKTAINSCFKHFVFDECVVIFDH